MRSFTGAHFFNAEGKCPVNIYRVAFIGHRKIYGPRHLENQIEDILREILRNNDFVEFYLGRNGDFDILTASVIKRTQNAVGHENSSLILVQPYTMKDDPYFKEFYDEMEYPISPKTPPKTAIIKRNQWMIDNADLLIAYVEPNRRGGAMTTLKYAQKKELSIINLTDSVLQN